MANELDTVQQQHPMEAQGSKLDATRSDSGRSVEIEYAGDKTIIPAAVPQPQRQFSGSVRSQFASVLQSHFLACTNPDSAPPRRPPNAPRFRGVTKHKRTQRYEAHIWECKKQIYLGGFDSEILAAKSHDIMAIRCKGANCEILNFEISEYDEMLPLVERLSREDIISALRNYSKAQTAIRMGSTAAPASGSRIQPFPMPSLPAIRAGGVQKAGGGRRASTSTPRRTAAGALAAGSPSGLLHQQRRRRQRRTSLDISLSEEEEDDEQTEIETTEDADMPVAGGLDSDGDYIYPPRSQTVLPPMPHSAPPLSRSRRRHRSGQCPGAKISPRIGASGGSGGGGLRGGSGSLGLAGASPFAWSTPSSPHTPLARPPGAQHVSPVLHHPPSQHMTADEVAEYDSLDLNFVLSSLLDEPSLTYSANDESYLFESMPVDANHTALVHLNGVELFQQSGSVSAPDSPVQPASSGEGGAAMNDTATATATGTVIGTNIGGERGMMNGGDYFPGTPLPAAGAGVACGGSPLTPAAAGYGDQHQHHTHIQIQMSPPVHHTYQPFMSPFAAAF